MLYRAIRTNYCLPADGKNCLFNRSLCTSLARTVPHELADPAVRKQLDVEIHRLFGLALKHEERPYFRVIHLFTPVDSGLRSGTICFPTS